MRDHRIDLAPAVAPELLTARCSCGDWARSYTTIDEWSDALDAAQRHIAALCGDYQREENGSSGTVTVHGRG
jgi:hypothetical protein